MPAGSILIDICLFLPHTCESLAKHVWGFLLLIIVFRECYYGYMEYTNKDLQKHLQEEHKMSPFSEYLREIVYGGVDGIVTTFAVVAGFAGANAGSQVGGLGALAVLLFGLANLFADGRRLYTPCHLQKRDEPAPA